MSSTGINAAELIRKMTIETYFCIAFFVIHFLKCRGPGLFVYSCIRMLHMMPVTCVPPSYLAKELRSS